MTTETLDGNELQAAGLRALARDLGPVDAVRFLQLFDRGEGDYTQERHAWRDTMSLDEIADRIRRRKDALVAG